MRSHLIITCSVLALAASFEALAAPLHSSRSLAVPPMFEENQGQFPASTRYLARSHGFRTSFESGAAEILPNNAKPFRLSFPYAIAPKGVDRLATRLNYFHGNDPGKWVRGAAAYRKVEYETPGSPSLLFYWDAAGNLEFDLTLPPGQTADSAAFRFEGQAAVRLSPSGDLRIEAGSTILTLQKPSVYQLFAGVRRKVPCDYVLGDRGLIGFRLGVHDDHLPVTIDPTLMITAGTYLGGTGADNGRAVAVDSSGNIYIAGDTTSTDFPVTAPLQSSLSGTQDAFIAELNPSGSQVLFATYLGGSMTQIAAGIGVDASGNIYAAGYTRSTDFPTKNAAIGTFPDLGGLTGWVAKLNNTGSTLLYSTFLGGTGTDQIDALAVDSAGNAYVTGGTFSNDFPIVNGYEPNGFGTSSPGFDQSFLTKFSTTGTITYSTITTAFGGDGKAVAVDNNGIAVFVNACNVQNTIVKNAYQSQPAGGLDAYVVKVDTKQTGSNSLLFATFLGGSGNEQPLSIALDTSDNVYVAGQTQSTNFPLMNAYQVAPGRSFLGKLASSGSSLIFSTYFGGTSNIDGLATDTSGNAYVTGLDFSTNDLPQLNALAGQTGPGFAAAFSFSGSLIYSTYVGTSGVSTFNAIATSGGANVTITGQASSGIPVTANAVQPTAQSSNAFVLTLQYAQPAVLSITSSTPNQGGDAGLTTVSVRGSNIQAGASLSLQSASTAIIAFGTTVTVDSRGIAGTFDLRKQPDGPYDVVVTNPDTTTSRLPGAFTVSLGGAPQLYANVVGTGDGGPGLAHILQGGTRTLTVIVGNNGTADAYSIPVSAQFQSGIPFTLQNTLVTPSQNPGAPVIDYSQIPVSFTNGGTTYVPLIIPWIPAGGTAYFRLTFSPPSSLSVGSQIPLNVVVGNPYLMIDPNGSPITSSAVHPLSRVAVPKVAGLHTDGTAQELAMELITTPEGRLCLLNILNNLLALAGFAPGERCGEAVIQEGLTNQLAMLAGTAAAANNGGLDIQASAVQADIAALQTVLQCAASVTPVNEYLAAVQLALTTEASIDACTKFIVKIICQIVNSFDPNAKDGPNGVGSQLWISGVTPAPYTIEFENLPTASAPAGQVVITDQINPQLFNLSTFSLGPISFGATSLTPVPGSNQYSTKVDLRPAQNTVVAVNASLDNDGLITWTFQSLDPATGLPIQDPSQGFLPPNVTPPQGQGYVSFTVQLKSGLATGTAIPNQANVVFDNNSPILTNVWQNTIDATPPTSAVSSLTPSQSSNTFTVSWSGSDVGSGLQNYTIFNSVNGGPFTPWISNTAATSASCVAAPNSTQAFFSIATDLAGNTEIGKVRAEATTQAANTDQFVITTNPAGLLVSVDNGTPQASPVTVTWQIGSQHPISTSSPQVSGLTQYYWANWSDSGAISHAVTASVAVLTYTATFTTVASPAITKAFSPTAIQPGGMSLVTLTLSNSNPSALTGGAFTDTLTNMSAVAGAVGGTCGASPSSLTAGQTSLSFTAITIAASSSCTVTFSVTSSTVGTNSNTTSGVTTTQTPTAGAVSNTASLTVLSTPTISKAFNPTSIVSGGNSTVTVTITNGNGTILSGGAFTDTLVNMSAVGGAVGGTCTGTTPSTLSAGATALSFSGITIPSSSTCTVTFSVTSTNVAANPNTTSGVTTTQTPTAGTGSNPANLTVTALASPTISKAFNPTTIQSGGTSTVTLTLSNSNASTTLTGGAFTDNLVNMSAAGGSVTGTCTGTTPNTLTAGTTSLGYSGISIPANSSCTVIFSVTSNTAGVNPNSTSGVTTTQTPITGSSSNVANLTVFATPTISKAFSPTSIPSGGSSTVTLTLSNSNASALTGGVFSDTLSNMSAVGGAVGGTCSGTTPSTLTAGATTLSFSVITIPSSSSCTVTFSVTSANVATNPNSTSGVTTTQTPTAGTGSNTANLTVTALSTPTILKAFNPTTIQSGGGSTVTLTITNNNASTTLTGGAFTDMLSNMTAAGGSVTGTCAGTTPSTLPTGATAIGFTGITIPSNASCTIVFSVTSSTAGVQPNSTSGVTTTQTTTAGAGSNTANLTVLAAPTISKAFNPTSIASGGSSTVTLTLSNSNATTLTGGAFSDTLSNMSAVGGAVGGTCSGTTPNTLTAGATALSFSGITIPSSSSCTVTFSVTSGTTGSNPNSTSGVTTTHTPTAGAASNTALLSVNAVSPPAISKAFNPTTIQSGGTSTVTLTLSNSNASTTLTGGAFSDTLANMSAAGGAVGGTCAGTTPNTLTAGATALSFSVVTIPSSGSCTVIFTVTSSTPGVQPNATSGVTTTQTATAGAGSNMANLTVLSAPGISKAFSPSTILSGNISQVTLTLSNTNATTLTGGAFSDTLTNMSASGGSVSGTCVGTTPNTLGSGQTALSFTGITIPASSSCTITFNVTSSHTGVNPNITSGVSTTQTPTAGAASNMATLTVGTQVSVTSVTTTTANGHYKAGAMSSIQVNFSGTVNVTGTPQLALNSGGTASYTTGSGTSTLNFTYMVLSGQNSSHLDYTSTGALTLNGGTLNDTSNNPVVLNLPTPGATGSLSASSNIVIDTVAPTVVSYSVVFGTTPLSFNMASNTRNRLPWAISGVTVVFSEPINAVAGSLSGISATGISGSGTNTVTWTFPAIINLPSTLTKILGTTANAVTDLAGNPLGGGTDFSQTLKVLYGDVNDDGFVNAQDLVLENAARSQSYNILADFNGDGVVDANDVIVVRSQIGDTNP